MANFVLNVQPENFDLEKTSDSYVSCAFIEIRSTWEVLRLFASLNCSRLPPDNVDDVHYWLKAAKLAVELTIIRIFKRVLRFKS